LDPTSPLSDSPDRISASRRFFDNGRLYKPITLEQARKLADDRIPTGLFITRVEGVDVGWVFYIDHPDPLVVLGGNSPLLVDRTDASVHQLWTAESVETQLTRYRQEGRALPHRMEERFGPSLDP
jgi:hypothetical protein